MNLQEKEFVKFTMRYDAHPFELQVRDEVTKVGDGEPQFHVTFHEVPGIADLLRSTSLALGEAYMDKAWEVEGDLYEALNAFLGQIGQFSRDDHALRKLIHTSISKKNQRSEVASHYDIGNDFYELWLDETMSYSCGYFKSEEDSLHQAQVNKVDRILEKLCLTPGMTLCDIGCGWGYLLIQAAKKYQAKGVGITLSVEQKKAFEEQIAREGLQEMVEVHLLDYRDLTKSQLKFDRVVSVGMVEHVGRENYMLYMEAVKSILKPGGLFLLHFISALQEHAGDPCIKKYIFPGGVVPSLREMVDIAGELELHIIDVESLRRHYNRTLLCWNENYQQHRPQVVEMFGERFARMWELYLCSCAATFQNGIIDVHQVLLTNGVNNELPMTRWY